jgi:hypothetical protein
MIAGSRSVRSCRAIGQDAVFIPRKIGAVERSQGTRGDCPISRRTWASKTAIARIERFEADLVRVERVVARRVEWARDSVDFSHAALG